MRPNIPLLMKNKELYQSRIEFIKKIENLQINDGDLVTVHVGNDVARHWSTLGKIWLETFNELIQEKLGYDNCQVIFLFEGEAEISKLSEEQMNKLGWYRKLAD